MKQSQSQNDDSMFKGASSYIFRNAKKLRENMTKSEIVLWEELKQKKFHGLKFRCQHPIQTFIADFYCHQLKLIVEIDGGYHEDVEQTEKDKERTEIINFNDINVLRFSNDDVINNINTVLAKIEEYIK